MSEAQDTDLLLVNRNGTSYKQEIDTMRDRIDDTDLLLVYRGNQAYKITGRDFIDSTQDYAPPVITNAVLSEDSPGGTRFANQEFDVTYNMSNNGVPDSSKLVKPYVIGGISLFGETSAITNVAQFQSSVAITNVSSTGTPQPLYGSLAALDDVCGVKSHGLSDPGASRVLRFTWPSSWTLPATVEVETSYYGGGGWTNCPNDIWSDGNVSQTFSSGSAPSNRINTITITSGTYFELPGTFSTASGGGTGGVWQSLKNLYWNGVLMLDGNGELTFTNDQGFGYFVVGDLVQSDWNQSEDWSGDGSSSGQTPSGYSWAGPFNGVLDSTSGTNCMTSNSSNTFTFGTPVACTELKFNVYRNGGSMILNVNEPDQTTVTISAFDAWTTTSDITNITSLKSIQLNSDQPTGNSSALVYLGGIYVDGKLLVDTGIPGATGVVVTEISPSVPSMGIDSGTWAVGDTVTNTVERQEQVTLSTDDITAIEAVSSWNQSRVWSSNTSGSFYSGYPATRGFDGDVSTYTWAAYGTNVSATISFSPAVTGTKFEIFGTANKPSTGIPDLKVNGSSIGAVDDDWKDISSIVNGSLTTIELTGQSNGSSGFTAFKVDDQLLVDTGVSGSPTTFPRLTFATDTNLSDFTDGWALKQDAPFTPETSAITTVDDNSWTSASAPAANSWASVAYGDSKFVAVSNSGSNPAMYSTDGISWAGATGANVNTGWNSVTYGTDKFVAVVNGGTSRVMYSADGITWTGATAANAREWQAVAYGDGKFVAVGNGTNKNVMYSSNGINWFQANAWSSNWMTITYGNGKWVAFAVSGTVRAMYSTDGITWTSTTLPSTSGFSSVAYGNGTFVATANNGSDRTLYSTDGITWSSANITSGSWRGVTFGDGKFVAIADSGSLTMYSTDGITWTSTTSAAEGNSWLGVTYGGGKFVAVSQNGTNQVMWSGNGIGDIKLTFTDDTQLNNFQAGDMVSDWNQDQVWSDNITGTVYSGASYAKEKVFDGDLTTYSLPSDGNTLTWTPSTPISATSVTLHVFSNSTQASKIQVNGSDANTFTSGTSTYGDITVALSGGQLQTVSWSRTDAYNTIYIYGISIGGKELVDTGIPGDIEVSSVAPASNEMTVNGGTWTNGDTVTGPVISGTGTVVSTDPSAKTMNLGGSNYAADAGLVDSTAHPKSYAFDGRMDTYCSPGFQSIFRTLFGEEVTINTSFRIYSPNGAGNSLYYKINNGNATQVTTVDGWITIPYTGTTSSIKVASNTGSINVTAIEIDGTILVDLSRFAIGSEVETASKVSNSAVKLWCVTNALGSISDLSTTDPGYTTMATGNVLQTLTFPGTFPSGVAADTELPVGTTLAVDVQATNMIATVSATTNVVTPTT